MQPYTALVIEDDPAQQMLIRQALGSEESGCTLVEVATTREEGRRYLDQMQFDVLLVDNRLPDGRGLDLVVELREAGLDTPCVLMTNAGSETLAVQAWRHRLADYIIKDSQFWRAVPQVLRETVDRNRAVDQDRQDREGLERAHATLQSLNTEMQITHDSLVEGQRELSSHANDLEAWNDRLQDVIDDLRLFGRAVANDLIQPASELRSALDKLPTSTAADKKRLKKAQQAVEAIEETAQRLHQLNGTEGRVIPSTEKALTDLIVRLEKTIGHHGGASA